MRLRLRAFAVSLYYKSRRIKLTWGRGLLRLWIVLSVLWAVVVAIALRPDEVITDYQSAKAALGKGDGLYSYDDLVRASQNAAAADDPAAAERLAQMADRAKEAPDGMLRSSERTKMDQAMRELKEDVAAILAPILISFALGAALLWAVRGFRKDEA